MGRRCWSLWVLLLGATEAMAQGHSMPMPMPMPQQAPANPSDPHAAHGRSAIPPPASSSMAGHGAHQGRTAAEQFEQMTSPHGCPPGSYYHLAMSMCLPRPVARGVGSVMPMVNGFFVDTWHRAARGSGDVAAPNTVMVNAGIDTASWNRIELDLMLTAERWTLPSRGYPLLLQIGERNAAGAPYIDAQHPHSSPIMGLTLTSVFSFRSASTRLLRLSFAPRGASMDGPIPFMHRPTGMLNPDAPLGHHIGQDVGHISSTVFAAGLYLGDSIFEVSTFHGREPAPGKVDLPLAAPNSFAARLSHKLPRVLTASVSFAYLRDPEQEHFVDHVLRFSASAYTEHSLSPSWRAHTALIWGAITNYEGADFVSSLTAECLFFDPSNALWGRAEAVQRTASQLAIQSSTPDAPNWVGAVTQGYTRRIVTVLDFDVAVGASVSLSFVPRAFHDAYAGHVLVTGRLLLELRGMKMWTFGGTKNPRS